jgi:hypothetical protein
LIPIEPAETVRQGRPTGFATGEHKHPDPIDDCQILQIEKDWPSEIGVQQCPQLGRACPAARSPLIVSTTRSLFTARWIRNVMW